METTVKQLLKNTVDTLLHPMFQDEPIANRLERIEFIKFLICKYDWLPTRTSLDKEMQDFARPTQLS